MAALVDAASWDLPTVFQWLKNTGGLSDHDLAITLNCGIGMAVVCAPDQAENIATTLRDQGETVFTMGTIEAQEDSAADPIVRMRNTETAWS